MHEVRRLKVKDVMNKKFVDVKEDTPLKHLVDLLEKHEVPVFIVRDKEGNFVGDVHETDLLKLAMNPAKLSEHEIIGIFGTKIDLSYFGRVVGDIMTRHDVTVGPDDLVEDVVAMMIKEDLSAMPVVEDDKIVGVVTELDILEKIKARLKRKK